MKGKRYEAFLATKAVMRGEPYTFDSTIRSVEDSLKRLGTDYIDLIQMHELNRDNTLGMGILAEAPAPFLQGYSSLLDEARRRMDAVAFLRKPGPKGLIEPAM